VKAPRAAQNAIAARVFEFLYVNITVSSEVLNFQKQFNLRIRSMLSLRCNFKP